MDKNRVTVYLGDWTTRNAKMVAAKYNVPLSTYVSELIGKDIMKNELKSRLFEHTNKQTKNN